MKLVSPSVSRATTHCMRYISMHHRAFKPRPRSSLRAFQPPRSHSDIISHSFCSLSSLSLCFSSVLSSRLPSFCAKAASAEVIASCSMEMPCVHRVWCSILTLYSTRGSSRCSSFISLEPEPPRKGVGVECPPLPCEPEPLRPLRPPEKPCDAAAAAPALRGPPEDGRLQWLCVSTSTPPVAVLVALSRVTSLDADTSGALLQLAGKSLRSTALFEFELELEALAPGTDSAPAAAPNNACTASFMPRRSISSPYNASNAFQFHVHLHFCSHDDDALST